MWNDDNRRFPEWSPPLKIGDPRVLLASESTDKPTILSSDVKDKLEGRFLLLILILVRQFDFIAKSDSLFETALKTHSLKSILLKMCLINKGLLFSSLDKYSNAGIILACAMCAMAHRFLKWRIEIFTMRHNGAYFFATAHQQNLDAP